MSEMGNGASLQRQQSAQGEPPSYETVKASADYILKWTNYRPKIGIICGSGLGLISDEVEDRTEIPFESIPNFTPTSVSGHAGKVVLGTLFGIPIVCMKGRIHFYEGHPLWKCGFCVRVMKLMGVESVVVTNAAGAINQDYKVGDFMILKDHLNMSNLGGDSPLRGGYDSRFGPRFVSMTKTYDARIRQKVKERFPSLGLETGDVHEGVYVMTVGPNLETPTELRALKILGADVVGMSTIPEVLTARQCGIRVFSFSLITNVCIMESDSGEEAQIKVEEVGKMREGQILSLIRTVVEEMDKDSETRCVPQSSAKTE